MKKALILHSPVSPGAPDDEQDTMAQVREVSAELSAMGFDTVSLAFSLNMERIRDQLREQRPDFVFNLVEAVEGQDRFIVLAPVLLESLGMPFTGSGSRAVMGTTCKTAAKALMLASGIDTPPWVEQGGDVRGNPAFPGTFIVKSVWDHASIGLDQGSVIQAGSREGLVEAIGRKARMYGREFFAESFIDGREFNISIIAGDAGPEVLPPAEILFQESAGMSHRIVDYSAKWRGDSKEYIGTPRSFDFPPEDGPLLARLVGVSMECRRLFGMAGYARVDFRVDGAGAPWVLEVNANPCLTTDSGFIAAALRGGLGYGQVIRRIVGCI